MNPDNPYAAPQTIEPHVRGGSLSMAEAEQDWTGRRFADWNDKKLKTLQGRSQAIQDQQVVWLVLCFIVPWPGILLCLPLLFLEANQTTYWLSVFGFCFMVSTFVRFGMGFARTEQGRAFALVMDSLLLLGSVAAATISLIYAIFVPEDLFQTVFVLPLAILVGFPTGLSLRAMLQAPELFGPQRITHEALCDEVEYRRANKIGW